MLAKDVLTEEWLADFLQDSLEMDWTSTDGARAIMRALKNGAVKLPQSEGQVVSSSHSFLCGALDNYPCDCDSTPAPPTLSENLRDIISRLPAAPWRVTRSLLDGFGASLEVDNGSNFGNIGHIRSYDAACALADLVREVSATPTLATVAAANDEGVADAAVDTSDYRTDYQIGKADGIEAAARVADVRARMAQTVSHEAARALLEALPAAIRLLSQGGGK